MAFKKVISEDTQTTDKIEYKNGSTHLLHDKQKQNYGTNGYKIETESFTHESKRGKVGSFLTTWSIEPVFFLFLFGYQAQKSCIVNLMLDKACRYHLNYPEKVCRNLDVNIFEDQKIEVEKLANVYGQYVVLASMGIGALVMIFAGPWSDRYGRKWLLIVALAGMAVDDIGAILNTIYFEAPLEYFIPPAIVSGVTGGFICGMTMLCSFTSDVTTKESRTIKFTIVEFALGLGSNLGIFVGGILYKFYSYELVFAVAAIGHIMAFLWAYFFIPETRGLDVGDDVRWTRKLKDLFAMENLTDGFKAFLKQRPNHGRLKLWLLLVSICALTFTSKSFYNIAYVYAFHMYNWGPTEFSIVVAVFGWGAYIILLLCVPLLVRIFKTGDPLLGLIGTISVMIKNTCLAFAIYPWIYFLGEALGLLSALGITSVRSSLSKVVEKDELGKVFTFAATYDSLVPLITTIAMTYTYNATVTYFPGLCYLIAALVLVVPLASFWWMARLKPATIISPLESESEAVIKRDFLKDIEASLR